MIQFVKLCLIFCVGLQYARGAPNSGYVYNREVDGWLRLHMVPASWADAGMRCYLEGGVLASPTTSDMATVMAAMMAEHDKQLTDSVFTGINSILHRENFTSLEGVPLSSIPLGWAPGQPDNENSDEDCVVLTGAGKLADVSCESFLPYFCRKESARKCGSTYNGYEYEPRTGSCYKFHRASKTWRAALDTCHTEGGHLAIINSDTESTVLKEIFDKNPRHLITDSTHYDYALIGFRKFEDGEWATLYGATLTAAGFNRWTPGEPNNFSYWNEACGSVERHAQLNDVSCTKPYSYICEITP